MNESPNQRVSGIARSTSYHACKHVERAVLLAVSLSRRAKPGVSCGVKVPVGEGS